MPEKIVNPSILPGFMELLPNEQILFNKMLDKIKNSYEKYAFLPIDTPVIEKSEILLAKMVEKPKTNIQGSKGRHRYVS